VVRIRGCVGTGGIYPRIVAARCDANAHADTHANASVAVAHAAVGDDAGHRCAVGGLAGIREEAALAVAGVIDVVVARLWVGLHCDDEGLKSAVGCEVGVFEDQGLSRGEGRGSTMWSSVKAAARQTRQWCCDNGVKSPRSY